jgi:hypothetical protein
MTPKVTFSPVVAESGNRPVSVLLGASAAVTEADGGWVVITRPKNKGFTTWAGYNPYQMTITLMFDGLSSNRPQERDYGTLSNIMRKQVGPTKQPSPVRLSGPVPMTNLLWVIQTITQDPVSVIRRSGDGKLLRVSATVVLMEYVEADVLVSTVASPSPATRITEKIVETAAPAVRSYTVKNGDTLVRISQVQLGSWKRYTEIATLNDIRDPNRIQVGQVLKLP